jgi:hypothetical protein
MGTNSYISLFLSLLTHSLIYSNSLTHRTVEYLDLEQGKWVAVENMLSRRSTLGVAVFNGELYAVGGFDGTTGLDTVEKYNPGSVCVCAWCVCVCFEARVYNNYYGVIAFYVCLDDKLFCLHL